MTLLITPILLFMVSFLILNKDVVVVSRLIVGWILLDLFTWQFFQFDFFYLRAALIDILMLCTVSTMLEYNKAKWTIIPIIFSLFMNLYEHVSYYQTIFYEYRYYIQFCLMQLMLLSLLFGCKWRNICKKTNMQN